MTITLTKLYVKTFEENVRHLAQQSVARLRPYVMEKQQTTSNNAWPRVAAVDLTSKATTGRVATPTNDTVWSNRCATPATKHQADTVEHEDIVQMLVDPQSNIVKAYAAGANRAIDDIIIAAATGAALDEAAGSNTFPAGQELGGDTTAFNLALVAQIAELFLSNNIDPNEPKCLAVTPNCMKKALSVEQFTSSLYQDRKALAVNGFIPNLMGFDWVSSTRLLIGKDSTASTKSVLAFTKRAIGLLVAKDVWTRVAEDPTISFAWRIYVALTMGAVRVEDEQIVRATILES